MLVCWSEEDVLWTLQNLLSLVLLLKACASQARRINGRHDAAEAHRWCVVCCADAKLPLAGRGTCVTISMLCDQYSCFHSKCKCVQAQRIWHQVPCLTVPSSVLALSLTHAVSRAEIAICRYALRRPDGDTIDCTAGRSHAACRAATNRSLGCGLTKQAQIAAR